MLPTFSHDTPSRVTVKCCKSRTNCRLWYGKTTRQLHKMLEKKRQDKTRQVIQREHTVSILFPASCCQNKEITFYINVSGADCGSNSTSYEYSSHGCHKKARLSAYTNHHMSTCLHFSFYLFGLA